MNVGAPCWEQSPAGACEQQAAYQKRLDVATYYKVTYAIHTVWRADELMQHMLQA